MKIRSWPLLLLGFGALLALIGISAAALQTRIGTVRADVQALQEESKESSRILEGLRSEIYLFGVLLRDYLLERSPEAGAEQRLVLENLRKSTHDRLTALEKQKGLKDGPEVRRLQGAIEEYWAAAEPVFEWTPEEKAALGPAFLRQRVVPQREIAFQLASDIEAVSLNQSLARQAEILRTQEDLKRYVGRFAAATLLLGAVVTALSILRTRSLEATAESHLNQMERDAQDLRRLSLKVSKAQEDERKSISRELHDQVGQMLTALRMELGNLETFRREDGPAFSEHLQEAKNLTEQTLRTVRDMSMGLRPSVLDELGLGPALKWQAREFTRRSGVPVEIEVGGRLDLLADTHRTCVYRVVQEALTNCARHARATVIKVDVRGEPHTVRVSVEDNGVGFDVSRARARGLGLLGAEERVRELGGTMEVSSQPSKGSLVFCEIPVLVEVKE